MAINNTGKLYLSIGLQLTAILILVNNIECVEQKHICLGQSETISCTETDFTIRLNLDSSNNGQYSDTDRDECDPISNCCPPDDKDCTDDLPEDEKNRIDGLCSNQTTCIVGLTGGSISGCPRVNPDYIKIIYTCESIYPTTTVSTTTITTEATTPRVSITDPPTRPPTQPPSTTGVPPGGGSNVGGIIGGVIAGLVIIAIVVVLVIFLKKKRDDKLKYKHPTISYTNGKSGPPTPLSMPVYDNAAYDEEITIQGTAPSAKPAQHKTSNTNLYENISKNPAGKDVKDPNKTKPRAPSHMSSNSTIYENIETPKSSNLNLAKNTSVSNISVNSKASEVSAATANRVKDVPKAADAHPVKKPRTKTGAKGPTTNVNSLPDPTKSSDAAKRASIASSNAGDRSSIAAASDAGSRTSIASKTSDNDIANVPSALKSSSTDVSKRASIAASENSVASNSTNVSKSQKSSDNEALKPKPTSDKDSETYDTMDTSSKTTAKNTDEEF